VNLSEVFLGMIALATLAMALIQVGAIVAVARLARDAQKTLASVQQDVKPLVAKVTAIADEASKTATIATAQAEKIDRLVSDLTRRIEDTSVIVQQAVITPAREGLAVIAAIKAGLGALRGFRDMRPANGRQAEEEDPLFIG
jgi:septal ring factor EnvC (AmiA/AmiB activator)